MPLSWTDLEYGTELNLALVSNWSLDKFYSWTQYLKEFAEYAHQKSLRESSYVEKICQSQLWPHFYPWFLDLRISVQVISSVDLSNNALDVEIRSRQDRKALPNPRVYWILIWKVPQMRVAYTNHHWVWALEVTAPLSQYPKNPKKLMLISRIADFCIVKLAYPCPRHPTFGSVETQFEAEFFKGGRKEWIWIVLLVWSWLYTL